MLQDRYLCFKDVKALTGLSRSTVWRMENDGNFPARRQLTPKRVGWLESETSMWVESRAKVSSQSMNSNKSAKPAGRHNRLISRGGFR